MRTSLLRYWLSKYQHPTYKIEITDDPLPRLLIKGENEHIAETIKTNEILAVIYTPKYLHIIKPGGLISMVPIFDPEVENKIKYQKYIPFQYTGMTLSKKAHHQIVNEFGIELISYSDRRYYICVLESYKQCCYFASKIGFDFNKKDFSVGTEKFLIDSIEGYNYFGSTLLIEIKPNKIIYLPLLKKQDAQIAEFKTLTEISVKDPT